MRIKQNAFDLFVLFYDFNNFLLRIGSSSTADDCKWSHLNAQIEFSIAEFATKYFLLPNLVSLLIYSMPRIKLKYNECLKKINLLQR